MNAIRGIGLGVRLGIGVETDCFLDGTGGGRSLSAGTSCFGRPRPIGELRTVRSLSLLVLPESLDLLRRPNRISSPNVPSEAVSPGRCSRPRSSVCRSFRGLLGVTTISAGRAGGVLVSAACSGGKGGNGLSTGMGGWSLFEASEGIRLILPGGAVGMDEILGGGFTNPEGYVSGNDKRSLAVRENVRSVKV